LPKIAQAGDRLVGLARFPGADTATVYEIASAYFDAKGMIVDYTVGITYPQDLVAGETGTFELLAIPAAYATYEVYPSCSMK